MAEEMLEIGDYVSQRRVDRRFIFVCLQSRRDTGECLDLLGCSQWFQIASSIGIVESLNFYLIYSTQCLY
jgi:hypothetical protein